MAFLAVSLALLATASAQTSCSAAAPSIFDLNVTDIDGENLSLDSYSGRVGLILNVASF